MLSAGCRQSHFSLFVEEGHVQDSPQGALVLMGRPGRMRGPGTQALVKSLDSGVKNDLGGSSERRPGF